MFDNIIKLLKKFSKKDKKDSKDAAKERLQLVLTQDRANVSADFLELMKQEIIEIIKKYIDVDENSIDVKLTNKLNSDGTTGAPSLYANIPIVGIKNEAKNEIKKAAQEKNKEVKQKEDKEDKKVENKKEVKEQEKSIDRNIEKDIGTAEVVKENSEKSSNESIEIVNETKNKEKLDKDIIENIENNKVNNKESKEIQENKEETEV